SRFAGLSRPSCRARRSVVTMTAAFSAGSASARSPFSSPPHSPRGVPMHPSKRRSLAYWITTSLVGLNFMVAGIAYLLGAPPVREAVAELGYPAYLVTWLGACKLLGGATLLAPRVARLKEWADA